MAIDGLNDAQRRAIESAIANAEDNLARANAMMKLNPGWVSGNGEPILEVIFRYERELRRLRGQP
jgi:hypothetical protein